jgi:hypothetical protein
MAGLLGIGTGVLDRFPKLRFVDARFPRASEPIVNHSKRSATAKRKILNDHACCPYPLD